MEDITNDIQDALYNVVDELSFKLHDVKYITSYDFDRPQSAEVVLEFIAGVRYVQDLLMDLQEYIDFSEQRPECFRRQRLQKVTISKEEYGQLQSDSNLLNALISEGVEDWSGWDSALEVLE